MNRNNFSTSFALGSAHQLISLVQFGSRNHECESPNPYLSLSYVAQKRKFGSYRMKYGLKLQDSGSLFPDPNTRSSVFASSECSSSIPSFIMKCYGDRSNAGLKSFTASVLYIIISDCRQIIPIQRRCCGDSVWVSGAAWINGNKAVSLTACVVFGLALCAFPASDWVDQLHGGVKAHGSQELLCSTAAWHKQQRSKVVLLRRDNPAGAPYVHVQMCGDKHQDTCM